MLSLAQISQAIEVYRLGSASLEEFSDWFEAASTDMFRENPDVLDALLKIDMAFSVLNYDGGSDVEFRKQLETAIRPFVRQPDKFRVRFASVGSYGNAKPTGSGKQLSEFTSPWIHPPVTSRFVGQTPIETRDEIGRAHA